MTQVSIRKSPHSLGAFLRCRSSQFKFFGCAWKAASKSMPTALTGGLQDFWTSELYAASTGVGSNPTLTEASSNVRSAGLCCRSTRQFECSLCAYFTHVFAPILAVALLVPTPAAAQVDSEQTVNVFDGTSGFLGIIRIGCPRCSTTRWEKRTSPIMYISGSRPLEITRCV